MLAAEVVADTSRRYIDAFERITASAFEPGRYPVAARLRAVIADSPWVVPA